jgi:molybdopterin-containing oxidoreductase family iron-sulfur binding subunit
MEENRQISRRDLLKATIPAAVALVSAGIGLPESAAAAPQSKRRYAMLIDLRRCIGCESCTVACKAENNIGVDSSWMRSRRITWNQVIQDERAGAAPDIRFLPQPCNHCENPACIKVCPTGATYKDEERGVILQRYDRCIGCRLCTQACPYTRRYFNWEEPSFPHVQRTGAKVYVAAKGGFNPLVPVREKGVVEKCTFCVQRIQAAEAKAQAENRPLRDGDVTPACVSTCLGGARIFGDLNDSNSQIAKLLDQFGDRVYRLQEHLGTEPKVFYIPET